MREFPPFEEARSHRAVHRLLDAAGPVVLQIAIGASVLLIFLSRRKKRPALLPRVDRDSFPRKRLVFSSFAVASVLQRPLVRSLERSLLLCLPPLVFAAPLLLLVRRKGAAAAESDEESEGEGDRDGDARKEGHRVPEVVVVVALCVRVGARVQSLDDHHRGAVGDFVEKRKGSVHESAALRSVPDHIRFHRDRSDQDDGVSQPENEHNAVNLGKGDKKRKREQTKSKYSIQKIVEKDAAKVRDGQRDKERKEIRDTIQRYAACSQLHLRCPAD